MNGISIICACGDDDVSNVLRQLLIAEGYDVRVFHRDVDKGGWRPEGKVCTIVVWSQDSRDCWPVKQMATAADDSRTLVHISLDPDVAPPMRAVPAPIDFSCWRGEPRGVFRVLLERIERVLRGDEPRPANHFYAALATGTAMVIIMGPTMLLRSESGPAPTTHTGATTARLEQVAVRSLPRTVIEVGGPEKFEETLVSEDIEVRVLRAPAQMRFHRMSLSDLEPTRPLARVQIRRGLVGQIMHGLSSIAGERSS